MVLNIKNEEVDRLARELAARTGESISEADMTKIRRLTFGVENQWMV